MSIPEPIHRPGVAVSLLQPRLLIPVAAAFAFLKGFHHGGLLVRVQGAVFIGVKFLQHHLLHLLAVRAGASTRGIGALFGGVFGMGQGETDREGEEEGRQEFHGGGGCRPF